MPPGRTAPLPPRLRSSRRNFKFGRCAVAMAAVCLDTVSFLSFFFIIVSRQIYAKQTSKRTSYAEAKMLTPRPFFTRSSFVRLPQQDEHNEVSVAKEQAEAALKAELASLRAQLETKAAASAADGSDDIGDELVADLQEELEMWRQEHAELSQAKDVRCEGGSGFFLGGGGGVGVRWGESRRGSSIPMSSD